MSVLNSIRSQFSPIHPQGYPFIGAFAVVAVILLWLWAPLGVVALIATAWCVYFFRDPQRITPVREGLIVAPADGRISRISQVAAPPELGFGTENFLRISIFMSVFDCHINRSPVAGRVERIVYRAGAFISADLDKASEANERNAFVIEARGGTRIPVVQIAGLVARRIVPFVREGELLVAGQRIGMIRFGSRVDVYLPAATVPLVGEGQSAIAGETVLADLKAEQTPPAFKAE
jgi:phosphatidylserine decarboxylase